MQTVKTFLKTNFKNNLLTTFTVAILLSVLFVLSTSTQVNATTTNVNILIKNEPVQFTEQTGRPFIDSNNRTLVPMRVVMEKYGCTVDWEQESFSAIVKKGDIVVKVPTKQQFLFVNGSRVDTDTVPQIINGRTYLPVAVVLRAVGADVQWDDKSRSVVVDRVGQGVNTVNTAPTAQPTQPVQPTTVNTNTSTTVPTNSGVPISDKPVGYDEFMSNFEVVKLPIHEKDIEFNLKKVDIRSVELNSEQLEHLLLAIPEQTLKTYITNIASENLPAKSKGTVVFYSNSLIPSNFSYGENGNTFISSRILIASVNSQKQEYFEVNFLDFRNWRDFI